MVKVLKCSKPRATKALAGRQRASATKHSGQETGAAVGASRWKAPAPSAPLAVPLAAGPSAYSTHATKFALRFLDDRTQVQAWLERPALRGLPEQLRRGDGFVKIRGFLPLLVADGVRHALTGLSASEWDRAGEGERDDVAAAFADGVKHRFSVAEVECNELLLGVARLLAQMVPGLLPNFSAGRYSRGDHITPHTDLLPECYTADEAREVVEAYQSGKLASAVSSWKRRRNANERSAGATSSATTALEKAMQSGDIAAVRRVLEEGNKKTTNADGKKYVSGRVLARSSGGQELGYTRWAAATYYLNHQWPATFGGHFIDLEKGQRHLPEFNTLVVFNVPRLHEVEAVCAPQGTFRYSIFGWWLLRNPNPSDHTAGQTKASTKVKASGNKPLLHRKPSAAPGRGGGARGVRADTVKKRPAARSK